MKNARQFRRWIRRSPKLLKQLGGHVPTRKEITRGEMKSDTVRRICKQYSIPISKP